MTDSYIGNFMRQILDPSLGFRNPEKGFDNNYPCDMNGKKIKPLRYKKQKLAANLKLLMDGRYSENSNKPKALAKDAGITLSSVQRALSGDTAPTLDTLEGLAEVFGLTISELVGETNESRDDSAKDRKSLSKFAVWIGSIFDELPQHRRAQIMKEFSVEFFELGHQEPEKREIVLKMIRSL